MRAFEAELQRTNAWCAVRAEPNRLRDMKADATLPDGTAVALNGSFAFDPEKLQARPDATGVGLHRNGVRARLQVHLPSLANPRPLIDRKVHRLAAGAAAS